MQKTQKKVNPETSWARADPRRGRQPETPRRRPRETKNKPI